MVVGERPEDLSYELVLSPTQRNYVARASLLGFVKPDLGVVLTAQPLNFQYMKKHPLD